MRTSAESSEHKLSSLCQWLEQGGTSLSRIQIVQQDHRERCVLARSAIAEGEIVFHVPRSHLFSLESAQRSDLGRRIQAALPHANSHVYLAAALLEERERPDSFWRPYLDVLPEDFSHMPHCFSGEELALLQGSQLLGLRALQSQTLRGEYDALCEHLPDFARFAFEAYASTRLLMLSRAYALEGSPMGPFCAPMVDMLNHGIPSNVLWTTTSDGNDVVVMARRDLGEGEEIFASYGDKGNESLLLHYGFMLEGNPHDAIYLPLCLPEGDALAEFKQRLLSLSSPSELRAFKVSREEGGMLSEPVLSFLRLAHAGHEDLLAYCDRPVAGVLSRACEARALRALGEACEERLAGFPTSSEEDEALLRDGALSANARTCIRLRRDEKRLLRACLEQSLVARTLLELPGEELERIAARPDTAWSGLEGYVRGSLLAFVSREQGGV